MRGHRSPIVVILVSVLLLAGTETRAEDPLVAAARARQEAVRAVDVRFHVKRFVAKGHYTAAAKDMPKSTGQVIPPEDATVEADNRLCIAVSRVRLEDSLPMWHLPSGELTRKTTISVSNEDLSKVYYPAGVGLHTEVVGIIRKDLQVWEIKSYQVVPLTMHFRACDPGVTPYDVRALKKTGQQLPVAGRRCEEYQHVVTPDSVVTFWFDAEAGYALRRIRKLRRGHNYEQYDVEYRPDAVAGMVPTSWVRTEFDEAGKVRTETRVTVTDLRINPALDSAEFDVRFPPGCHVDDQRTGKEYRVQADGDMRRITPDGRELDETIPQPGSPWYWRNVWVVVAGIVVVITTAVAVQYRRTAKRTS
ncbi:MAG: hypothetical protein K2P78_08625 [Gemmataceae bacterium]|nr:hypothetical protein [Gemmataceae bacterium]